MAPTLTLAQLRKLGPCEGRLRTLSCVLPKRRKITAAEARKAGATLEDILWVASALASRDEDVRRRQRLWAADVAEHVLRLFEREHPNDDRPRKAVEAARLLARGEIDTGAARAAAQAALSASEDADAWTAARVVASPALAAARAAGDAAWAAARNTTDGGAFWAVARAAACAAGDTEREWQFNRLIKWLGDEDPEPLAGAAYTFKRIEFAEVGLEELWRGYIRDARAALSTLDADVRELVDASNSLMIATNAYRHHHDLSGGGAMVTGRAWDEMRRASKALDAVLAKWGQP